MKFLRFVWKLFVMASVFGVGYIVGREHSFEEEEQWEAENRKKDNEEGSCCGESKSEETCENKSCEACGEACAKKSSNDVTFEYEDEKAAKVALVGSFNNWNKDADPMNKEGNSWKLVKTLEAGSYEYQFVVNDTDWVVDPKSETLVKNKYEGQNSVIVVK